MVKDKRCHRVLFAALAGLVLSLAAAASPVNVLIVEADVDGGASGPQYAPLNFAGTTPQTVSGITYHALSDPGSPTQTTYSWHAANVRNRLIGADGPNNPVKDIYCMVADDFLNDYVKTDYPSSSAVSPAVIGNNIKIVNNSWVGSYGDTAINRDAVRRMDYMIAREDLLIVSGAVSSGAGTPLAWAVRNGIAVRGSQGFSPSHGTNIGKTHADLWGKSGYASYQTPDVSGYAAGLIDAADTLGYANGQNGMRHEVVKSILMTGADKTAFDSLFTSWTSNGINNLDDGDGAGRADYAVSLAVLEGGPQPLASVTGGVVNAPVVTDDLRGWWYESGLGGGGGQALIVDLTSLSLTDLTATLAWDVTQAENGSFLDTTDAGVIFANLDLELLPVTYSGGVYSLGSSLGIAGLMSKSTGDNVEHLYFTGGALTPGFYAFNITNLSGFSWNYGFSYRIDGEEVILIPEPGTMILCLISLGWATVRRHYRPSRQGRSSRKTA